MPAVDVALFAPLAEPFTYLWPEGLGRPETGIRVLVPLGATAQRMGVVERVHAVDLENAAGLKPVADRIDALPLLPDGYRRWSARLAAYYLARPGARWETVLAWAGDEGRRRYRLRDGALLRALDPELADLFGTGRRIRTQQRLCARVGGPHPCWRLRRAVEQGAVEEVIDPLPTPPAGEEGRAIRLNQDQERALGRLSGARGAFGCHLLFGCTGSGKTEVYLRAAEQVIADGGQVLVLVPEIGLTPMWMARVAHRLGRVGLWHSALDPRARHAVRMRLGRLDAVVGTRSALFLPLPRLGLIVVDEEHDASFKQQEGVPFSARDMAVLLAQELGIPVVLGSATPSVESWWQAERGRYRLLELPRRVGGGGGVATEVVDMRGSGSLLSDALKQALEETRRSGGQSLLYLNRRGYAPALHCTACGGQPECRHCSARLTLHRRRALLCCHLCGWQRGVPDRCEACGEQALVPLGAGTERIVELLAEALPELRVARLDRDAAASMEQRISLLDRFAGGEIDCLIGTQMVVKGHHFPRVTLVGVVQADLGLNLPDVRAAERWWQQLTQVIGRAGRGDRPGRTLLQSYQPDHPWLQRLGEEQARAILRQELANRRAFGAPPFSRWVRLVYSAVREGRALEAARNARDALEGRLPGVRLAGPVPCVLERINRRYRFELLLRDASRRVLPWALAPLLQRLGRLPSGVRCKVDVDPLEMM
ncbi:MAG: primosomal protein N' [Zetaproteobacteria bacterium]|nr:MAG: primosomal protein N' [Zetaproteobacteria bacterium]